MPFATVAKPLHKLTENTPKFQWTQQSQEDLDQLRRRLTSALVLVFNDYTSHFCLTLMQATQLSQADEQGREHVIAYASHTLSKAKIDTQSYPSGYTKADKLALHKQSKFKDGHLYYTGKVHVLNILAIL